MVVLIDYDNVPDLDRARGIAHVIDKTLHTLGVSILNGLQRVKLRLYGGWYEGRNLSKRGQQLSADVRALFPRKLSLSDGSETVSLLQDVELAYSLQIDPSNVFHNTYRRRGKPSGLQCESPPFMDCVKHHDCSLLTVYSFIDSDACPEPSCRVSPADILRRGEQKLVDTMLTADLIYLASGKDHPNLCVVSSDDDVWPGIRSALILGSNVFHIHTKASSIGAFPYKGGVGGSYLQLTLK
jgi:hypothetical protein